MLREQQNEVLAEIDRVEADLRRLEHRLANLRLRLRQCWGRGREILGDDSVEPPSTYEKRQPLGAHR